MELSGIQKRASPHTLRRSFATILYNGNTDLLVIKTLLAHESLATTQIYLDVPAKRLHAAVASLAGPSRRSAVR